MRDTLYESLSAMLDDEAQELETARVLKATGADSGDDLGAHWDRWHLYRSVLQGEQPVLAPAALRGRVLAAIAGADADPSGDAAATTLNPGRSAGRAAGRGAAQGSPRWLRPVASAAVAATVALAVVAGFQPGLTPDTEVAPAVAAAPLVPGLNAPLPLTAAPVRLERQGLVVSGDLRTRTSAELEVAARQRLQAYMLRHAQHRAVTDSRTVMPLVRVAAFEGE